MKENEASLDVIRIIHQLASNPEKVKTTQSSLYDLMGSGLTKSDICDAICDWIDEAKRVQVIVTKYADGHIGEPAYVVKPDLLGVGFYIKVAIQKSNAGNENLLIISAHKHH
ncbi:MAG: hypothetical protein PHQ35_02610 [Phycisphaerae bacterium]|nr:hypothetical protein [Phycisphaerae bacterium]MDD5380538.1 hypothetical protein [Phycisphaerae bacterium]